MSKKTTIYDIAEKAEVSPSTVSRVLNNPKIVSTEVKIRFWVPQASLITPESPEIKQKTGLCRQ